MDHDEHRDGVVDDVINPVTNINVGDAAFDPRMTVAELVERLAGRFDLNRKLAIRSDREEAEAAFEERRQRTICCLMHMAKRTA